MEKDFKVGLYRRIFNKNLKEAIEVKGFNYTTLREKIIQQSQIKISQPEFSSIVNFKENPTEEKRIALALALEVPIDEIFPEKYDELYERISPAIRNAEVKIDFLRLNSPEVLALQAPDSSDTEAIQNERRDEINMSLLVTLPDRERRIINLRFGLKDGICYTLEDVAKRMGVTRERIRQMEAKALERLRTQIKLKELI